MLVDSAPEPSDIAEVHEIKGRRLHLSDATGDMLKEQAKQAHEKLIALKDRPPEDEKRMEAEQAFVEANLDLQIFDASHDPTGALKREITGIDLVAQFSERTAAARKRKVAEADLAGQFEARSAREKEPGPMVDTPERITPVFLVNMGELDRLNKEGHDLGDNALTALAGILTDKVLKWVAEEAETRGVKPESLFKIYRADSNSFMIRFTADIPKVLAKKLESALSSQAGEAWEGDLFGKKGVETPPVIVDSVSLEEALGGLPDSMRGSGEEDMRAVGFLKDVLFTAQDARKIVSRTHRLRDLIAGEKEAEAKDLFDKYLKKSLVGVLSYQVAKEEMVKVETFEQLKGFLQSKDAIHDLWRQAFAKGLTELHERHEKDANYDGALQKFVVKKVKEEHEADVVAKLGDQKDDVAETVVKGGPFERPSKDEATEGLREFARLRTEAGFFSDNLKKAEAQKASPGEIERLERAARIAKKKLILERMLRDPATGLELRGSMFKKLETALAEGTKRVATVSMDMGFLKYFDQVGGRETGDLAILKVAEVLQKVKDAFSKDGVEISAHRLGGDEFGMTVVGGGEIEFKDFQNIMRELRATLLEEIEKAGEIPPQDEDGARRGYYATKLHLGIGTHIYENGEAAEFEDKKYQLTTDADDESTKLNKRAEHSVKVSDKVMEFQKSTDRLRLILDKMQEIQEKEKEKKPEAEIAQAREHLNQLLGFSDKAVFGEAALYKQNEEDLKNGKVLDEEVLGQLKKWRQKIEEGETAASLDSEVHEYVWRKMDEEFETKKDENAELVGFIDLAVRIKYLQGRVDDLELKLNQLIPAAEKERERHEQDKKTLNARLAAAEEELAAIRDQRAGIRAAA